MSLVLLFLVMYVCGAWLTYVLLSEFGSLPLERYEVVCVWLWPAVVPAVLLMQVCARAADALRERCEVKK